MLAVSLTNIVLVTLEYKIRKYGNDLQIFFSQAAHFPHTHMCDPSIC